MQRAWVLHVDAGDGRCKSAVAATSDASAASAASVHRSRVARTSTRPARFFVAYVPHLWHRPTHGLAQHNSHLPTDATNDATGARRATAGPRRATSHSTRAARASAFTERAIKATAAAFS